MFEGAADKVKEMLYMKPAMWLESNKVLTIENCTRIEEYNDIFMQLAAGELIIRVWGCGLRASDFASGGLVIRGKITSVEFDERGKGR